MNKRGFELQFNIIFVIIVGLIVFGFFLFFTFKYIDLQKEKESVEIARSMNNIIRGLKSTTQYKEFDINFDFDMDVNCDEIIINNGLYGQKIDSIFFASSGRGKDLWFWSRDLQKPFRIDTLLFIIDNSKKYYSNKPGFFPEFINEGNSNNFNVGVFFEGFSGYCPNSINGEKIVCVEGNSIFIDSEEFPLIDDTLVYGAAFASAEQYSCSFDKIIDKWINLLDIYLDKNDRSTDCSNFREDISAELNIIKNSLNEQNFEFDTEGLRRANTRLSDHDCEVVY